MGRFCYIFAVFLLSFSGLTTGAGKPGFFDGDPETDEFGESLLVSRPMSLDAQKELLRMIVKRIEYLESDPLSLDDFEASVAAKKRERQLAQRYSKWCWAGGCAVLGAGVSVMGMEWLLYSVGRSYQTISASPHGVWFFMGALGASLGGSLGFGFAQAKNSTMPLGQEKKYYSFRMEEILKVAAEVSLRMRAVAVPIGFWSVRRERFFQARFPSFQALEGLILKDEQKMHQMIEDALKELGLSSERRDEITELTETEIHWMRVIYQKRLRHLELETLYQVLRQLKDPDMPKGSIRLKPSECADLGKGLKIDPFRDI